MPRKNTWSPLGWVFGLGTLFALLSAVRSFYDARWEGADYPWWSEALPHGCIDWYLWALLSIPIYQVVRRLARLRLSGVWLIALHLPIAAFGTSVYMLANIGVSMLFFPEPESLEKQFKTYVDTFFRGQSLAWLAVYVGIVAACYAFHYYQPALRASQLETSLANAKLKALQMQLQPHFLFNTLHAIGTLLYSNVDAAERMLIRLADLLRLTLACGDRQELSLSEELQILDTYLEIEAVRFQDRLTIERQIAPETLTAQLPALLLQPLAENAIRHGIARQAAPGLIRIRAWRAGESLALEVTDNGPGLSEPPETVIGRGVGLANTRERLLQLYGARQSFELKSGAQPGLTVSLRLPFRTQTRTGADSTFDWRVEAKEDHGDQSSSR
ncbi:MAG: sensor histidine kinase [Planctomycetota bacterium]